MDQITPRMFFDAFNYGSDGIYKEHTFEFSLGRWMKAAAYLNEHNARRERETAATHSIRAAELPTATVKEAALTEPKFPIGTTVVINIGG